MGRGTVGCNRGLLVNFLREVSRTDIYILILVRTKKFNFLNPFVDLRPLNSTPILRPDLLSIL